MSQIAEIIKYEGDNSTFIWKHPSEDFNSLTQLIVHESQEAIFFMNGQALDLFGAGRYTLETQNIPLIGKALNRATGDVSPFHCEVYFINKTEQMSINGERIPRYSTLSLHMDSRFPSVHREKCPSVPTMQESCFSNWSERKTSSVSRSS